MTRTAYVYQLPQLGINLQDRQACPWGPHAFVKCPETYHRVTASPFPDEPSCPEPGKEDLCHWKNMTLSSFSFTETNTPPLPIFFLISRTDFKLINRHD